MTNPVSTSPKPAKTPRGRKPKAGKRGKKGKKIPKIPTRCKTSKDQGIYVSHSRCKFWLDSNGINKHIVEAINELKDAEPHLVAGRTPNSKSKMTKLIAFDKLSDKTKDLVKKTRALEEERLKQEEEREKVRLEKLAQDLKEGRVTASQVEAARKQREEAENKKTVEKTKKEAERKAKGQPERAPKKVTEYSNDIELLNKMKIRFSKESATLVAGTICTAMHELMEFGMASAIASGLKILKSRHILQPGYEQLPLSCFYKNLDAFKWGLAKEAARVEEEQKKKAEKKAKKAKKAAEKETEKETEPEVENVENGENDEEDEDEDEEDDERNFGHYIRQVCYDVMNRKVDEVKTKTDEKEIELLKKYGNIQVSKEIREFGSQLVVNFIQMMNPLLKGQIKTMGVKTISPEVIKQIIDFMLMVANISTVEFNATMERKLQEHKVWKAKKKVEKEERARLKKEEQAATAAEDAEDTEKVSDSESKTEPESENEDDESETEED